MNSSFNIGDGTTAESNKLNITAKLLAYFNGTTMSEDADAQLYSMLHDVGQTPVLIVPALFLCFIGLIGIPFNAFIVYITIKHQKTLNRNANYLIALNAFFDMLQLTHPFPFFFVAISGTNFIGTFQSLRLLVPSIFGIQCSLTCMACTGVDRLLSVLMPMRYHRINYRYSYCALHTGLCIANGVWNVLGLWQKCAAEAEKPVTGFIGQIGWDSSKDIVHYLVGPVLICITILCYIAIGLVLYVQKKLNGWQPSSGISQQQQKLLKSLALIVCVHVGTQLFGSILLGSAFYSAKLAWYLMTFSLCTILLGASSNAIVLYLNSTEYRLLFNAGLADLKSVGLSLIGIVQIARIFTIGGGSSVSPAARLGSNRTGPI